MSSERLFGPPISMAMIRGSTQISTLWAMGDER
jgi:hypothetical protein